MNVIEIIRAAEEGDLTKLGALLERNPKLAKAKDERPGATALHFACWAGQQDAVQLLLDYGADMNLEDDSYRSTPLGWALENGQTEMFDFLLIKGAKIKPRQAVSTGRLSMIQEIVAKDPAFINDKRENMLPIHEAALFGQKEMLAYLLENGAQVDRLDDFDRTALDITLLHPLPIYGNAYAQIQEDVHLELAEMLLAHGAEMKLWHAAALGKLDEARAMIQRSPAAIHETHFDVTPLYSATLFGHTPVVAFLLENGANVNQSTSSGRMPIHAVTWSGSVDTAQLLLDAGADLNGKASEDITPLHQAVWRRHSALVQWLIENGADQHAVDAYNHTPLDLAQATESVNGWYPGDWGPVKPPVVDIVDLLQN